MFITTLQGRYYGDKGPAKFNESKAPAEVMLLLSSNSAGGRGGTQASLALHMLPGATEKQMLFWWQELGGQLSVSTRHHGSSEKRAVSSFFFFYQSCFIPGKQTGQAKESTRVGGLCQVFCHAVLKGRKEASAGPAIPTSQTRKNGWGPREMAAPG